MIFWQKFSSDLNYSLEYKTNKDQERTSFNNCPRRLFDFKDLTQGIHWRMVLKREKCLFESLFHSCIPLVHGDAI